MQENNVISNKKKSIENITKQIKMILKQKKNTFEH